MGGGGGGAGVGTAVSNSIAVASAGDCTNGRSGGGEGGHETVARVVYLLSYYNMSRKTTDHVLHVRSSNSLSAAVVLLQ